MLKLPIDYYAYSGLLNFVTCFTISIIVFFKQPKLAIARLFSLFALLISTWSLFYFLWLRVTDDSSRAHFLVRTCCVSVVLMPPIFLHFVSLLTSLFNHQFFHKLNYLLSWLLALTVYTRLFSPGVFSIMVFPFWPLP